MRKNNLPPRTKLKERIENMGKLDFANKQNVSSKDK